MSTLNIRNISLELTQKCTNFCRYCYWNEFPTADISLDTAKQTLLWLVSPEISGDNKEVSVSFFGGEPLLKFDLLKEIVEYSKTLKKKVKFSVTTNGILLDLERIQYLTTEKIDVLYSIDGMQETNDIHRKLVSGEGTFDKMIQFLPELIKKQPQITGRMTLTPQNCDKMFENIVYLIETLKFTNVAPTPVSDDRTGKFSNWDDIAINKLEKQYQLVENWISERITKKVNNPICIGYLTKNIRNIINKQPMQSPCGAGKGYLGISVDGGVFPCHRFTHWAEWKVGTVNSFEMDLSKLEMFRKYSRDASKPSCKNCSCHFCGGNCFAANQSFSGDILKHNPGICKCNKLLERTAQNIYEKFKGDPFFMSLFRKKQYSSTDIRALTQENRMLRGRVASLEYRVKEIEKFFPEITNKISSTDVKGLPSPCVNCPKSSEEEP